MELPHLKILAIFDNRILNLATHAKEDIERLADQARLGFALAQIVHLNFAGTSSRIGDKSMKRA